MNANAQTGDTQDAARLRALLSQLNWLNALNDEPANGVYEYQFHSDAHITGEFTSGLGPYSFLNTVPIPDTPGIVTAPIILRLVDHLPEYRPDMSKKDETFYHGGTMVDELAALSSLCIGARIMAGGESRRFEPGKDPMGRPCAWDYKPAPFLRVRPGRYVLPSITGTHSLDNLNMLKSIPKISPERYVNLIRSPRLVARASLSRGMQGPGGHPVPAQSVLSPSRHA